MGAPAVAGEVVERQSCHRSGRPPFRAAHHSRLPARKSACSLLSSARTLRFAHRMSFVESMGCIVGQAACPTHSDEV